MTSNTTGTMRSAWYERQGPRVRVHVSAVDPSDTKGRGGWSGPMPFARIIPHQDGDTARGRARADRRRPFLPLMRAGNVIRTVLVSVMPESAKEAAIHDLEPALRAGALDPLVQRVYPLDEIAAAHAAQDDHPTGKLLVALA